MSNLSEFFDHQILWGVLTWRLALAVVAVFLGFLTRRLIMAFFTHVVLPKAKNTEAQWDDEVAEFLPAPLAVIGQVVLWFVAAWLLQLPTEPVDFDKYVTQGLEVALWVGISWLLFRVVDVLAGTMARAADKTESKLDDQLIPLIRRTLKMVIAITIIIMVVQNLGYSVTSLVASLGVGGLALALAAQDTVANLFGSLVIFTDRPFQIGDWVEFSGVEGTVEEVGFRTTTVRRFDKSTVSVPNSTFSSNPIVNHSRRNVRRISMTIGVTYETSAKQLADLLPALNQLLASHDGLDQEFHFARFVEFGASSLDVQIYCFSKSTVWTEYLETRETLMLSIMELLAERGLEMAFPTRTLYLRDEQWPNRSAA